MSSTRSQLASLALSLAAHALLIGFAAGVVYTTAAPRLLVPVTLLPGGGGAGGREEANAGAGVSAAVPAAAVPAAAAVKPVQPAPAAKPKPRVAVEKQRLAAPAYVLPRAAGEERGGGASGEPVGGADPAEAAGVGEGGGSGGRGRGAGSGTGIGAGPGRDLDLRLYCISCPEPPYPRLARARGWQGATDVELTVLADGRVEAVILSRSSGFEVLDRAALDVARQSRFSPPPPAMVPPVRGRLAYRFELKAR